MIRMCRGRGRRGNKERTDLKDVRVACARPAFAGDFHFAEAESGREVGLTLEAADEGRGVRRSDGDGRGRDRAPSTVCCLTHRRPCYCTEIQKQ